MSFHEQRRRAASFGQAAGDYDKFRPQYPNSVVEKIIDSSNIEVPRALDVGSGTGILAEQLRAAGCEVLAIEPDPKMAAVAQEKGLAVEVSTFEGWEPDKRTFDIVTFGQSFHWVDPELALPRVTHALNPGGNLALVWNSIEACGEIGRTLTSILKSFASASKPSSAEKGEEHPVLRELHGNGFDAIELNFEESLHYSRDAWLSMVFTYSAQLTMEPQRREQMFDEMFAAIPAGGLHAHNEAQLILGQPSG